MNSCLDCQLLHLIYFFLYYNERLSAEVKLSLNEGVYNFLKSNSQNYNFTDKLHFTILDYRQNFEGSFR